SGLLARALTLLLLLEQLVGVDDDAALLLVVSHAHGGHDPRGLGEGHEVQLRRDRALRRAELGDEAGEIFGKRPHLLLLALERDEDVLLARLQVEDALARLADGAGGEMIRLFEFEGDAHVIPSAVSSPSMELTVSAAEPDALYASAVMEAVPIMIRWNRSSGVPRACAVAALIGSAWETATRTLPGCRATMRAMAPVTRACISVRDSPSGKRKPLGCCWTAFHSGLPAASLSAMPVHRPMA